MKQMIIVAVAGLLLAACGNQNGSNKNADAGTAKTEENSAPAEKPSTSGDQGIGKFTKVDIADKLDAPMADKGQKIYDLKCSSCHKLSGEKLVGPGWKDVTTRHKPEWIMNFITNTEEMLNKDEKAKQQLEVCLVRMPNQNLTDDEARQLLEYMRKNDGVK